MELVREVDVAEEEPGDGAGYAPKQAVLTMLKLISQKALDIGVS